jgi:hypothetical protein
MLADLSLRTLLCIVISKLQHTVFKFTLSKRLSLFVVSQVVAFSLFSQSPPACTSTLTLPAGGAFTINSGQVLCLNGAGLFSGTIAVNAGGHLVVCGAGSIFGSVFIAPGATYWHTSTTGLTGSMAMFGTEIVGASSCGGCVAPTVVSVSNGSRCGTGTVNISADVSAGATVRWYTVSTGGASIGSSGDNATFTTPSISATTTYFAEAWNGSCALVSSTVVAKMVIAMLTVVSSKVLSLT